MQLLRKFKLSVEFRGWGRLNFNSQLLPIKYSEFVFNLLKVCIDNVFYVNVSSVGVFFSSLFRFNEMGCFRLNGVKRLRNGHFQIVVSLLFAHYPIIFFIHTNSIAMLYLVHRYKKKFESTNMDLTHSKIMIFSSFSS